MRHHCTFDSQRGATPEGALRCECGRWGMPEDGLWLRVPQMGEFDVNFAIAIAIIIATFLLFT